MGGCAPAHTHARIMRRRHPRTYAQAEATPAYASRRGRHTHARAGARYAWPHEQVRSTPAYASRCALRVAARETRLRVVISAGIKPSELAPYGSKSLDLSMLFGVFARVGATSGATIGQKNSAPASCRSAILIRARRARRAHTRRGRRAGNQARRKLCLNL